VSDGVASQISIAVGVVKDGVAGHSTELGPGNVLSTGAVLSVTLMIWNAVDVLPQSSMAVQVRVTLYSCGQVPGVLTSLKVSDGVASHASVAVGVANEGVAGHSTELGAGKLLITGAVLSVTLMV
jgi:hypothetical protein